MKSDMKNFKELTDRLACREVLFASDNGSKAWGYDSPASDFDVKYVFSNSDSEYMSLFGHKELEEYKSAEHNTEAVGWDLKKFLLMTYKGNANAYEVLFSPVSYKRTWQSQVLAEFVVRYLEDKKVEMAYHYYGLAYKTYKERVENKGENVTAKKYLYVVRPVLNAWELLNGKFPNLHFPTLLEEVGNSYLSVDGYVACKQLLDEKRAGKLSTDVKTDRLTLLDETLEENLKALKYQLDNTKKVEKSYEESLTTRQSFDNMFLLLKSE